MTGVQTCALPILDDAVVAHIDAGFLDGVPAGTVGPDIKSNDDCLRYATCRRICWQFFRRKTAKPSYFRRDFDFSERVFDSN